MKSKRKFVVDSVQKAIQDEIGTAELVPGSMPFVREDSIPIARGGWAKMSPSVDPIQRICNKGYIDTSHFYGIVDTLERKIGPHFSEVALAKIETVNDLITHICHESLTRVLQPKRAKAERTLREALLHELNVIIEEQTGVSREDVTPDMRFVDDLDIDSLSMVHIAITVEDKIGVHIPDDRLATLNLVDDAGSYVLQQIKSNPNASIDLARKHMPQLVEPIRAYLR